MPATRTIYARDCLEVMSDTIAFPEGCVDLIYLDPPFNSKSKYNIPFPKEYKDRQDLKPVMAFQDTWSWGEEQEKQLEQLNEGGGRGSIAGRHCQVGQKGTQREAIEQVQLVRILDQHGGKAESNAPYPEVNRFDLSSL